MSFSLKLSNKETVLIRETEQCFILLMRFSILQNLTTSFSNTLLLDQLCQISNERKDLDYCEMDLF